MKILLVEDDPALARGLQLTFQAEGYEVLWADSLKSAFEKEKIEGISLVVLDLGLTDGSGFVFLEGLRAKNSRIPVIILTAKDDEDTLVDGFQKGANDYMRKPFSSRELLARVKAVLREPQTKENQIRYQDLVLYTDQRSVKYKEVAIDMNRREFDVLLLMVKKAETVVTREVLMDTIDKDGVIFDRTIDSHISHLRTRFKTAGVTEIKISSVYGLGYRLERA